eukprot:jgi/Chrzof1/10368/Cz04g39110.t1
MAPKPKAKKEPEETLTRIAIVSEDRCKPKKCRQECKKSCPVVKVGKLCIEVTSNSKIAWISEELCIGCGICVKKCPFDAIMIINLPKNLEGHTTHRYGPNSFKLHRMPMPRPGQVLGLVGTNGIGKSTALKEHRQQHQLPCGGNNKLTSIRISASISSGRTSGLSSSTSCTTTTSSSSRSSSSSSNISSSSILRSWVTAFVPKIPQGQASDSIHNLTVLQSPILAGKMKPNLGRFESPPDWEEILLYFRGSELQNYFTRILEDDLKAVIKPQYVDHIPKAVRGNVDEVLDTKDQRNVKAMLLKDLDLEQVLDRNVEHLSGGELQRFAIAVVAAQAADVYMIDEPSSYLDVRQRLKAAQVIRSLLDIQKFVIVVEHDLSVLDYLSDFICCLYGKPGAYGVVTLPFSVREGINIFLAGFVPTENLRFREESLTFKVAEQNEREDDVKKFLRYQYPAMTKTQGSFKLHVEPGEFTDSEIIVMLGENGTGKTTFIRILAGMMPADDNTNEDLPSFNVSYKPQKISPKFEGTVRQLLHKKIRDAYLHPQFTSDVMKPLTIEPLMDQEVQNLSGGELQRVALALCLGQPADIYLIDEPSAYLDSEQRIMAAKVIKRFIMHSKKTAFIVEHDFIMATYLADRVIVYEGQPSKEATARTPQSLLTGMNLFLSNLDITFRRDPTNYRPRINKWGSTKDREQKDAGTYYYIGDE